MSLVDVGATVTAPWWAVPVVAGGFALFGVAVTQWFNWLQRRRERADRWDADVRSSAVAVLAASQEFLLPNVDKVQALKALHAAISAYDLVGGAESSRAGQLLVTSLPEQEEWTSELLDPLFEQQRKFIAAVRKDLGIKP